MIKPNYWLAAVLLLLAPASNGFARGEAVASLLQRWGLTGSWALRCDLPPSESNIYSSYVADIGGGVSLQRNNGKPVDSSEVETARILPDGAIEMVINFTSLGHKRQSATIKGPDGRIRALYNRAVDGAYTVRDGKFLHNGRPTAWQTRCR